MSGSKSNFLRHLSCETCGSSDANGLYSDGHTHCFACGATTFPEGQSKIEKKLTPLGKNFTALDDRKISKQTAEKYGIWRDGGNTYFPYFNDLLQY